MERAKKSWFLIERAKKSGLLIERAKKSGLSLGYESLLRWSSSSLSVPLPLPPPPLVENAALTVLVRKSAALKPRLDLLQGLLLLLLLSLFFITDRVDLR